MDKLPTLTVGEPGWNKVWNHVVKQLDDEINGLVTSTGWISEGFTVLNGFSVFSPGPIDTPAYQIYSVGGVPTVLLLKGSFTTSKDITSQSSTLMTVPDSFGAFWDSKDYTQVTWFSQTDNLQPLNLHFNRQKSQIDFTSTAPINKLGRIQINTIFRG